MVKNKYSHIKTFEDLDRQETLLLREIEYSKLKVELIQHKIRYEASPARLANEVLSLISNHILKKAKVILKQYMNF